MSNGPMPTAVGRPTGGSSVGATSGPQEPQVLLSISEIMTEIDALSKLSATLQARMGELNVSVHNRLTMLKNLVS